MTGPSMAAALLRVDDAIRRLNDLKAAHNTVAALLREEGDLNARLARELAEAHTEIHALRYSLAERANAMDALQAQCDELLAERP